MRFGQINGKALIDKYWNEDVIHSLIPNYIADSPNMAMDKIFQNTGLYPSVEGGNIELIEKIRKLIYETSTHKKAYNSLLINAPHTHWESLKPVVYSFDAHKNRYIVGPEEIDQNRIYFPVSFAITNKGLIPYEWCDDSNKFFEGYRKVYLHIDKISRIIEDNNFLGISVAFRFKRNLYEYSYPTIEVPLNYLEPTYISEKSCIILLSKYLEIKGLDSINLEKNYIYDIRQVSWHSKSHLFLNLNQTEEEIYLKLKCILEECKTEEERDNFFKKMKDLL